MLGGLHLLTWHIVLTIFCVYVRYTALNNAYVTLNLFLPANFIVCKYIWYGYLLESLNEILVDFCMLQGGYGSIFDPYMHKYIELKI